MRSPGPWPSPSEKADIKPPHPLNIEYSPIYYNIPQWVVFNIRGGGGESNFRGRGLAGNGGMDPT